MRAYVLLKVKPQDTVALMHDLKDYSDVVGANVIHGPYDCLLEVKSKNLEGINKAIQKIREHGGITDSMTCLVTQSWKR